MESPLFPLLEGSADIVQLWSSTDARCVRMFYVVHLKLCAACACSSAGDSMHVIRDALLSQLQNDRLRQEIIEAELARIERAMALRSAAAPRHGISSSPSATPEHVKPPVQFAFEEQHFAPHGRRTVGVDEARDLEKEGGVQGGVVRNKTETPCKEDDLVLEGPKTSGTNGKPAGQENAESEECKQESVEAVPPKKASPPVKWSCDICQIEASSQDNLMQHFAGQKHCATIIALKARARAEKARKARLYAGKKPGPTWVCKFCPANCTSKSDLDSHLEGKKHHAKIQALLEECKRMAREADSKPNTATHDEAKPADSGLVFCGTCQVKCASPSVREGHVRGQKHQMNVQALQVEAKRLGIIPPKIVKKQQAPSASEEGEIQKTLYFCKLCNLHCNSKNTLGEHRLGKKHLQNVEKRMLSSFCHVCNLQCNSEKMLAHHCTGSKHQANLNGC